MTPRPAALGCGDDEPAGVVVDVANDVDADRVVDLNVREFVLESIGSGEG